MLENVGVAHASVVVITFANPDVALRILRAVRELRTDVPILVRTQDDAKLEELQAAGATEVVPETFEASLMLLSHLLLLMKVPVGRVIRTRERYSQPSLQHAAPVLPRQRRRASGRQPRLSRSSCTASFCRPMPGPSAAASSSWPSAAPRPPLAPSAATASSDAILGPDTVFKEGDVVVVYGTPEAVEHAETLLLMG